MSSSCPHMRGILHLFFFFLPNLTVVEINCHRSRCFLEQQNDPTFFTMDHVHEFNFKSGLNLSPNKRSKPRATLRLKNNQVLFVIKIIQALIWLYRKLQATPFPAMELLQLGTSRVQLQGCVHHES